jgi:hypothetical protein
MGKDSKAYAYCVTSEEPLFTEIGGNFWNWGKEPIFFTYKIP